MKKLLQVLLFTMAAAQAAAMPVAYDSSSLFNTNPATYSSQGATKSAIAVAVLSDGAGSLPTGMTWAGVAMTKFPDSDQGVLGRCTFFGLTGAATGTNNISITAWAGTVPSNFVLAAWTGDGIGSITAGSSNQSAASSIMSFGLLGPTYGTWQVCAGIAEGGISETWAANIGTLRTRSNVGTNDYFIGDTYLTSGGVFSASPAAALTGCSLNMVPATIGLLANFMVYAHALGNFFDQYVLDPSTKALTPQPTPVTPPAGNARDVSYAPNGLSFALALTVNPGVLSYGNANGVAVPSPTPVRTPNLPVQNAVAYSPCGNKVAVGSSGNGTNAVVIYDVSSGVYLTITSTDNVTVVNVQGLAWSPDCSSLAAAHNTSPGIRIWHDNGVTMTAWTSITMPAASVQGLAWSPDGKTLAYAFGSSPWYGSLAVDTVAGTAAPNPTPVATMQGAVTTGRDVAWDAGGDTIVFVGSVGSGLGSIGSAGFNKSTGVFAKNISASAGLQSTGPRHVAMFKNGTTYGVSISVSPWAFTYEMDNIGRLVPNPTLIVSPAGDNSAPGNAIDTAQLDLSFTQTSTMTPTFTQTSTVTPTFTQTPTFTATSSTTPTSTSTPTFTQTSTNTITPSATPTFTNTCTSTPTFTATPTWSNTSTVTPTFTRTVTPTFTSTATPTFTSTSTATPTFSRTSTPTFTSSRTITPTFSFTRTATRTSTSTASPTASPTAVCGNYGDQVLETGGRYGAPMWSGNRYAFPGGRVDEFALYVDGGGSSLQMAVYTDAGGRPGTLVCQSGITAATIPGWQYMTASAQTFAAGNYWLLFQASSFSSRAVARPGENMFIQRYPSTFGSPPAAMSVHDIIYPNKYTFSAYARVCSF